MTKPIQQTFFVMGQLPGANDITKANRSHWSIGAKQKKLTQEKICWAIKFSKIKPMESVRINYRWCEPNRKRDLDNIAAAQKFINDAIVHMGILEDDGWRNVLIFEHSFEVVSKKEIGVHVTLIGDLKDEK